MLLESDILRLFFTGPYLVSSPLCSGVWCWLPLRSSTPTSLFASLLSSRNSSLFALQPPTASLGLLPPTASLGLLPPTASLGLLPPTASAPLPPTLLSPVQLPTVSLGLLPPTASLLSNSLWSLPLSGSRRQLSFSGPLTTSGYGEISCPRILCLVSRQNRLVCFGGLPP